MALQRTEPIRPKLHSTPKNIGSVRPLSSDANSLFFENMELREKNKILVQEYKNLKDEYDRLLGMVDLRKNVRKGILDRKYRDERQDYVSRMRDIHGSDLDMGTYTEEMLVGYNDPTIIDNLQVACEQSCPTGGISFGNLKNKKAPVNKHRYGKRSYSLLQNELNTKPRTVYLAKVINPLWKTKKKEAYHGHS